MKLLLNIKVCFCTLMLLCNAALGQVPPPNPFLIDSPFPFVHQNNYRQGYSDFPALLNYETVDIRTATTPNERVSPWLLLSETYPDGSRTIWGASSTHIWKAISDPNGLTIVSDYQIDFNPTDRSWSFVLLPNHEILTSDDNKLLIFSEEDIDNPLSPIFLKEEILLPENIGQAVKFNRLYDGNIMFAAEDGLFGLLSNELELLDTFRLELAPGETAFDQGETAFHNDYASDENGGVYIVTTERMIRLDASNDAFSQDWAVEMEFGGNGLQGVGTTPTLLGTDDDRLVCVVNSQTPAEMVVFWRDEIPADWDGISGLDLRVAAVVPLPGSSPVNSFFAAVENSPVAYGYELACGQYNGFTGQVCPTAKGLYKLKWDTASNTMDLQWSRSDINLNNVLMYSRPDNLIYGSGRENDCNFYYYGIDWDSGNTIKRFLMGEESFFDDPGDANIILDDQSIVFNTNERLVQIYPDTPVSTSTAPSDEKRFLISPNPFSNYFTIQSLTNDISPVSISIFDSKGILVKQLAHEISNTQLIYVEDLPVGFYILKIENEEQSEVFKLIKN